MFCSVLFSQKIQNPHIPNLFFPYSLFLFMHCSESESFSVYAVKHELKSATWYWTLVPFLWYYSACWAFQGQPGTGLKNLPPHISAHEKMFPEWIVNEALPMTVTHEGLDIASVCQGDQKPNGTQIVSCNSHSSVCGRHSSATCLEGAKENQYSACNAHWAIKLTGACSHLSKTGRGTSSSWCWFRIAVQVSRGWARGLGCFLFGFLYLFFWVKVQWLFVTSCLLLEMCRLLFGFPSDEVT